MNRPGFLKRISAILFALLIPKASEGFSERKRYFLTKFYIAGYYYYDGKSIAENLKVADELIIVQEPSNPFDKRALEIYTSNKIKLGYVPRSENPIPSRLIRQNIKIVGTVDKINPDAEEWRKIRVSLFAEV